MIAIINYKLGNLGSVFNMVKKAGGIPIITCDHQEILKAQKIILPGVGHFDAGMKAIYESGLKEILYRKAVEEKTPLLGICLGMQLLTEGSEEGNLPGLGWIQGYAKRFSFPESLNLKVPQMGWNTVRVSHPCPLTQDFDQEYRFYFVHSYCVTVNSQENSMLKTMHGIEFDSGIQKENIYGVQFHPEKSHRFGLKLLKNFIHL
ncbi:MAG: imidazole glycerol phosphate synthase subunit HisH [Candidatus Brocadiae bacterium]|nr:imidazole glycerol phosphate synthase subunit HisH [Candidatus Brocadiia bacterium]